MLNDTGILVDVTLDDSPTTYTSGSVDLREHDEITLLVGITKTLTPTNVILTVLGSGDNTNFYAIGRIFDQSETTPVASVTYTATGGDSLVLKDYYPYIKVKVDGTGTDATNYFAVKVVICARGKK
jgi:hypothetical protein